MKRLTCLLLLSFFTLVIFANQPYHFSHLSVKDGLSQLNVTSIYQDRLGYIWFGTRNGLNKFNGNSFEIYWHHADDPHSISNNVISCITEDAEGNLWIGTENGVNKLDRNKNEFQRYYVDPQANNSIRNRITSLCTDRQGTVWIGSASGLFAYVPGENRLKNRSPKELKSNWINDLAERDNKLYIASSNTGLLVYDLHKQQIDRQFHPDSLPVPSRIRKIHIDRKGNIWLGNHTDGIYVIKHKTEEVVCYNTRNGLSNNNVRCIKESPSGEIWIGTFDGLNILNPVTNRIRTYQYGTQGTLSHHSIYSILFDRMQTIWIGTYAGGVSYHNPYGHLFDFYNPNTFLNKTLGILGPAIEHDGILYIGAEGGGLIAFNLAQETFQQYILPHSPGESMQSIIKTVYLDKNRILCGTSTGEVYEFNLHTRRFALIYHNNGQDPIYHISRSLSGQLIVGSISTNEGLVFISGTHSLSPDIQTQFTVKGQAKVHFSSVICVCEISYDVFLIGTKDKGLFCYDKMNHTLLSYNHTNGLTAKHISSILKDRSGRIWVSSMDGGLSEFNITTGEFTTYNEKSGLQSNQVCKMVEGSDNNLWISTLNGISRLDLRTRDIANYNKESGIQVQEFSPCAGLRLSDNRIFFAGNNGFTLFNPNDIVTNPNIPPVVLDKLYINNNLVFPNGQEGVLQESISTQKRIVLNHNQTNITIEYCALNYIFNSKNQYSYKLEGFDSDWNMVGNRRTAYYTNIPAGTYHFVVKGSNNDGIWNEQGATLEIVVLPPLWKTWWAYLIYCAVAIALIAFIIRYFTEKKRLQNNIRLKQMEAEVHEEFYQERNRLFTNFSHELRTPLTLIMAPLEEFVRRTDLTDDIHYKSQLMLRNAQRLLRIVNNLMDLQKNESGTMKLQVSENDIIKFTHEAVTSFQELALYRNIHLKFKHSVSRQPMWFDWNLLEKVYFNFLSNAFKNVPDGGSVVVELSVRTLPELSGFVPAGLNNYKDTEIRYLTVSIQDNGVGIAPNELEKIFRPFYQVAQNEHSKSGTGIGLSLSKAIIEMHHGVVWADNAPGSGAVFQFVLPINKNGFDPETIVESTKNEVVSFNVELPDTAFEADNSGRKQATVLVVEDNRDLNNYICSCLADKYNVIGVTNGEEALSKATYLLPNLIITDLMMPKMNGIELIRRLKKDMNTSHIPIIMVTAKTGTDNIKEGYEAGADEYITKPFDASILKTRVDNIIQSREKLKELYSKNFSLESLGVDMTSVDEKFMQNLYATLQQNIANSELNLDAFCKELGLSKSNLYRKIKQITGYSPNEFIRNFRLETAAKMLKETDMTITEVYCAVGFNSLAYFSNCFKALYGVPPTEFKNKAEGK